MGDKMNFDIFGYIRSLGFGGLIGSGLAAIIFFRYPQFFTDKVTFEYFVGFGGLLGAATHRSIDGIVVKGLLFPIGRFVDYYGKLAQVELLRRRGVIDKNACEVIKIELTNKYFLHGSSISKLLPPND